MPLLRTETGCRWRNTLVSMTTTRLRRSRGAGWRKTLFQTCEFLIQSPTDIEHLKFGVRISVHHSAETASALSPEGASSLSPGRSAAEPWVTAVDNRISPEGAA